jgi:hypothetical protein
MAYNKNKTMVFVETKLFSQLVKEYLSDDDYAKLQECIMLNPEAGKIIRGSGGVRKIRWSRGGMGKSGAHQNYLLLGKE